MKNLVRVLLSVSLLAVTFAIAAAPASAGPCSAYVKGRNLAFDKAKKLRQVIAREKSEIAVAQSRVAVLSGEAEAAAKKDLAEHEGLLKWYEQNLKNEEGAVANYEELIAKCQGAGTPTSAAQWAGRWEGRGWSYRLSAEGSSLEYAFKNAAGAAGTGTCTLSGNVAHCQWKMRNGEGANGTDLTGTETLTRSGDTITAERRLATLRCIVSTPDCEAVVRAMSSLIGRSETTVWQRAK